jgi:hypothetical protein
MILAAADPNGPANMLAQLLFWTVGIVVLVAIGKTLDRLIARYLDRKEREATEAIADPVLAAHRGQSTRLVRALDRSDAYRERVTVPRQINERNTRT